MFYLQSSKIYYCHHIDLVFFLYFIGNMIIQCLEPVPTKGLTMKDLPDLIERVSSVMARTYRELSVEVKASLPQDYPIQLPEAKSQTD